MWTLDLGTHRLGMVPHLGSGRCLRASQPHLTDISQHSRKDTIMRRHYGIINFIFDVFMTIITSGLWLIWIFVREMRRR